MYFFSSQKKKKKKKEKGTAFLGVIQLPLTQYRHSHNKTTQSLFMFWGLSWEKESKGKEQYAYSPYCSPNISKEADKENFFHNQELLKMVIISSILTTFMFDSGVIL